MENVFLNKKNTSNLLILVKFLVWNSWKIKIDLVILNEEENSYEQYVNEKIYEIIGAENANYLLNINGGIHVLKEALMTKDEVNLIYSCSDMIIWFRDFAIGDAHSRHRGRPFSAKNRHPGRPFSAKNRSGRTSPMAKN